MKSKNKYSVVYFFFFDGNKIKTLLIQSGSNFHHKGVASSYLPKKRQEDRSLKDFLMVSAPSNYANRLKRHLSNVKVRGSENESFYSSSKISFVFNKEMGRVVSLYYAGFDRLAQYACLTKLGWYVDDLIPVDYFDDNYGITRRAYLGDCMYVDLYRDEKSLTKCCGKKSNLDKVKFEKLPWMKNNVGEVEFFLVSEAYKKLQREKEIQHDRNLVSFVKALKEFLKRNNIEPSEYFLGEALFKAASKKY